MTFKKKIVVIDYNFYAGRMPSSKYPSKHLGYCKKTGS